MATRLKSFSRKRSLKFISFTLVVLLVTAAFLQLTYITNYGVNPETIFVKEYSQSETFLYGDLSRAISDILNQAINKNDKIRPEPVYLYHITDGEEIYQNVPLSTILEHEKYLYKYIGGRWEYGENTYKNLQRYVDSEYTLYLVFEEEYMQQRQQEWEQQRGEVLPMITAMIISVVLSLLCIIHLIAVTGREPEDDEIHLTPYMDRIYSDIQLGIMLVTLYIWVLGESDFLRQYSYAFNGAYLSVDGFGVMILTGLLTGISMIICGVLLLSMARKIKARRLLKHSFIYTALAGFSKLIRSFFDDSRFEHFPLTKSLNRRQIIFTVSSGFMVFLAFVFWIGGRNFFLGMLPIGIEAVIIFWYFYENRKTYEEINQGFQESLQEQTKSERMKVDLITNVSHDLKTPLTSIISYVDLLSREELPDAARDYVNILADKSGRLKNIVSDLFDLAKSTSGNLPLNMENLDLKKLIEQTLGDMENEIEKSDIRIKTSLSEAPVHIYSDGKKLYRVFQNIIGNALKYSLGGTRVFIDMEIENGIVDVTIKNTASYDMDFAAEDVLQRFSRGDASRTTEGSGLGLSIAESFTWACGGRFKVEIDGDQFKVKLGFHISETE